MSTPQISVIIPVYNRAEYIKECVDSVLRQSFGPLEVIVVDDGSTDGTPDILRSYGQRIRLIQQPNRGVAHARNTAVGVAKSDWLAFLDSDDIWEPEYLMCQVENIRSYPNVSVHHTNLTYIGSDGQGVNRFEAQGFLSEFGSAFAEKECLVVDRPFSIVLKYGLCHLQATVMLKRKLEEVGMFPVDLMMSSDWVTAARLSRWAFNFCRRAKVRVYRRREVITHVSAEYSKESLRNYEHRVRIFTLIRGLTWLSADERLLMNRLLSREYRGLGYVLFREQRGREGRAAYRAAWGMCPTARSLLDYAGSFLPRAVVLRAHWRRHLSGRTTL